MIPMEICSVCGKKMPKHVLVKHMAKPHVPAIDNDGTTMPVVGDSVPTEIKILDLVTQTPWDMGEMNTCQQCHEEWPSRLMELHMHVRHGL